MPQGNLVAMLYALFVVLGFIHIKNKYIPYGGICKEGAGKTKLNQICLPS
jgi:hypothetical protein